MNGRVRNKEFDNLWDKKKYQDANLINLFNNSIPYSFNFIAKAVPDLKIAKEIVNHLENGYPCDGMQIKFNEKHEALYQYFLMLKDTLKFEDPNGVVAKKINYAVDKLWIPGGFCGSTAEAFPYTIKRLAEEQKMMAAYEPPSP